MNIMKTYILLFLSLITLSAQAVPVFSTEETYTNANGTSFTATAKGDEYLSFLQAKDGTIVSLDRVSGNYMVSKYDAVNNHLTASDINYPSLINPGLSYAPSSTNAGKLITNKNLQNIWRSNYEKLNPLVFLGR